MVAAFFENGEEVFFSTESVEAKSICSLWEEYTSSKFNLHLYKTKLISKQYMFNLRLEEYFNHLSYAT